MVTKYVVDAKDWDEKLNERFCTERSTHSLSDADIVECIKQFGRATIGKVVPYHMCDAYLLDFTPGIVTHLSEPCDWFILFENTYD